MSGNLTVLVADARRNKAWSLTTRSIHKIYLMYCLYLCRVNRQLLCRVVTIGLPRWRSVKNPPTNVGIARDLGLKHGFGKPPGVRNGNPLQNFCLGNSMDRGSWHPIQSMRSQRVVPD